MPRFSGETSRLKPGVQLILVTPSGLAPNQGCGGVPPQLTRFQSPEPLSELLRFRPPLLAP